MIPFLQLILNKIGKTDDAAAANTTLFAGQKHITSRVDDLAGGAWSGIRGAVGGSDTPVAGSLRDILNKDGSYTFNKATDSLEAIRDKLDSNASSVLCVNAACDAGMAASATTIVSAALAGYGDDYFNGQFWLAVVKNANSAGNAPEYETRLITDYVSATGTFTTEAFSANVEAGDGVLVLHESLPFTKYKEFTSGSGTWTVPKGLRTVDVAIVGAGGGGGGYGSNVGGGGGGGGETVFLLGYPVTPGAGVAYTVGTGGAVGPNSQGTGVGGSGGSSSFGGATALGGAGGYCGANSTYPAQGGAGGGTGGGAGGAKGANAAGAPGGDGSQAGAVVVRIGGGGGGGSTDGSSYAGGNGGFGVSGGGIGVAGYYGGGAGGGAYGNGGNGAGSISATAPAKGGGGGGRACSAAVNGSAGASGYILIMWR